MLVLQGDITELRFVDSIMLIDCYKYEERGEELRVPYYASAAAARDGNLPYIMANCLYS